MADKKLTEVDTSTSLADSDKLIGNIGNSVKQITLTNLVTIIKNKIGSLKNPHALTFTGAVDDTYDGSAAKTINIPTGSGGSGTTDYNDLENKPQINGVELIGNKTSSDLKMYTKEEVDYLLADKMDKPYYDISITDDTTIENTLAGNFKMDSIEGSIYQAEESGIVPTPERPVPIRSKKITVNGEIVELRSLKEGSKNVFDLNILLMQEETDYELNHAYTNVKTLILNLKPNTTYTASTNATGVISSTDAKNDRCFYFTNVDDDSLIAESCCVVNGTTRQKTSDKNGQLRVVIFSRRSNAQQFINGEAWVQIEEGVSATSYVPPTVRDYKIVDHTNKTSKIVRNIGFQNLNELNWAYGSRDLDHIRLYTLPSQAVRYVAQKSYCNVLESFYTAFDYSKQGIYCGNTSGGKKLSVMINQDILGDNSDKMDELFKAYINNPDAAVLYPLETPTEESIPYLEDDTSEIGLSWQDTTSPSPDIESKIYEVDEINIKLVGKNFIDINYISNIENWTNPNTDGYYYIPIAVPKNAQLVISNDVKVPAGRGYYANFSPYKEKNAEIYYFMYHNVSGSSLGKFTSITKSNVVYLRLDSINVNLPLFVEDFKKMQLEIGSVATPYTPYQETSIQHTLSKPLRKFDEIKDVINILENKIYRRTIKTDITTLPLWTKSSDLYDKENTTARYGSLETVGNILQFKGVSPILKNTQIAVWQEDAEGFTTNAGYQIHISINNDRLNITKDDTSAERTSKFVEYINSLKGTGKEFIYVPLNVVTEEPLDDELIQKLKTLKTFSPTTHVFVTGIAKPTLNAKYPKDIVAAQAQLEQKVLLMSETLTETRAKLLLQGGND